MSILGELEAQTQKPSRGFVLTTLAAATLGALALKQSRILGGLGGFAVGALGAAWWAQKTGPTSVVGSDSDRDQG